MKCEKKSVKMPNPKRAIVVVTGVGLKEARKRFPLECPGGLIEYKGKPHKMNAAAGAAIELSRAGHLVWMTGYDQAALDVLKAPLCKCNRATQLDLLDKGAVESFARQVLSLKEEKGLDVHVVHYGGASDTKVKLPGNSVFLDPWETPSEAIPPIVANATVTWLNILQALRPAFVGQRITKTILISAITAIRTKRLHALDAIQKGAVHSMARSLALDLTPERIYVTEIMPGITDTGFYDDQKTFDNILLASRELGYEYDEGNFPAMAPEQVGEAVLFALESATHVREISLMPYGQYPHLGA